MRPPLPADTPTLSADDPAALDAAADILASGGCVAVPTETVYGLAADASSGEAVAGIYEAKGRPRFNPLIAHVDTLERARTLIDLPPAALKLAKAFWPGPLTLVAPRKPYAPVSDLAAAGLDTLAVRLPASHALRDLVRRLDRPLAAPSANPSGQISPTRAEHVKAGLNGRIHLILDGGPCLVGVESTIVSFIHPDRPALLRPGGLPRAQIEAVTGPLSAHSPDPAAPSAPGQLASHYAPKAEVRLNATSVMVGEAYLAFGMHAKVEADVFFNLSPSGDLAEAAANLFSGLRVLDAQTARIAVAPIPNEGLGEAINDRLRRAAVR
jgi:L-threonylcarbamoyladenylate synthase